MTAIDWLETLLLLGAVLAATAPLGGFLFRVLEGRPHLLSRPLGWLERLVYRLAGVDGREQAWPAYAGSLLVFSAVGFLATYGVERLQHVLPLNPQRRGPVGAATAFNTAVSFVTNTNWQAYAGETTMSFLTQMAGLTWQNFVSAAAGLAVAVALARGLTRRGEGRGPATIGNFWVDLTRVTVYVLLPLSLCAALLLVGQGTVQVLQPDLQATTLEGGAQTLARGPVASQVAIKQMGTNGGGFYGANSAHPFENPTPLANFLQLFLILLIPAAQTHTFGRLAGDTRQGWALFAAMAFLLLAGLGVATWAEARPNPAVAAAGAGPGPNLEGKEVRHGLGSSVLWAVATTAASNGSVSSLLDSYSPLGGMVALVDIQLGEVVFGGVGAGLYGVLVMALLSVFVAGLMVGRTPEYLGKKVEVREVKLAMLYVLTFPLAVLVPAAWSVAAPFGVSSIGNPGPHGLTEIVYAFSSGAGNNGSAFAGLLADTPWYDTALGLAMLVGRFWMIVPVLALAGSLAGKRPVPPGPGTLPTHGPLFCVLLLGVIVIVGALTFFPVLCLGPVVEHFLAESGRLY